MTNREFFTAVAALENIPADLVEHAEAALVKMDETNAKRKEKNAEKPSKTAIENAPLVDAAVAFLGTETKIGSDIAAGIGVSVQKVSHLMKQAEAEGRVVIGETKLPKKGTVKTYTAVAAD